MIKHLPLKQINRLASYRDADRIVVKKFLMSADVTVSREIHCANLQRAVDRHNWSGATIKAIFDGILLM